MSNYQKMQIADKENLCQNLYEEYVVSSMELLKYYEKYSFLGKKEIPVASYTNFRDALFHFRKLVLSSEEHEILQQSFAVKEHLNRAKVDARTSVFLYYSYVASQLLKDGTIPCEVKSKLRIILHKMKRIVLVHRINGMMMSNSVVLQVDEKTVDDILEDFFDLVQEDCFEQFTRINNETDFKRMESMY